nr:immunoglobulin heavy chain junction region [Mus musculus]
CARGYYGSSTFAYW